MARTLCTREVVINHDSNNQPYTDIEAYIACRLIPLDKNPGIRPIGIGEVLRRIIGKAIIFVIRPEIIESAGNLQLCAGQKSGCEAAVHAMSELFKEEETDALLLVDASNAFNTLNREVLLHNIPYICPAMSTYVRNCYCTPSRLFILGGSELHSTEGTTQGDPFAMPVYAVGLTTLLPLIKSTIEVKHVAYADDLGGLGKLIEIRSWWDNVCKFGPLLGYYPEPSKSWLIVKEELAADAMQIFHDTEIKITTEGRKYLGGFIGKPEARYQYAQELVSKWIKEVQILSKIAKCEPQTAYTAFVSGYRHKLTYHIRTFENLSEHLKPLDDVITSEFIPAITEGHICSEDERVLLSLPVKLGGLAIPIFSKTSDDEFENSKYACKQLTNNIKQQKQSYESDLKAHKKITNEIIKKREAKNHAIIEQLRKKMSDELLRANDLAQMKGASNWLTSLPLKDENYILNKREFFDALAIRYRWKLKRVPSICACGKRFDMDHAMSCLKGGFIHQRHDIIRDTLAKFFSEVCTDVEIEPTLIPLTGEVLPKSTKSSDDARFTAVSDPLRRHMS